ncbi:hypothetical protein SH661x_002801 [Planctomicrobium sp. SH661]|uniref:hypothetical protein n=1 Tax=Planctomicrobium sp. SH661 TaxID=3448124 RepID=UPI003F5B2AB7
MADDRNEVLSPMTAAAVKHCRQLIRDRQLEDGPFRMTAGGQEVWLEQYFSLEAVLALLAVAPDSQDDDPRRVEKYLIWYAEHIEEPQGIAFNYRGNLVSFGKISRKGDDYDSIDSYAGLYLLAAARTFARSETNSPVIQQGAIRSLQALNDVIGRKQELLRRTGAVHLSPQAERNGLPIARDDYPMHYLMDACEAHAGLRESVGYFDAIGLKEEAVQAQKLADGIADSTPLFLAEGKFAFVVDNRGLPQTGTGAYPDGLANLYALAYIPKQYPQLWTTLIAQHAPLNENRTGGPIERWLIAARTAAPESIVEFEAETAREALTFDRKTHLDRMAICVLALIDGQARYPTIPELRESGTEK